MSKKFTDIHSHFLYGLDDGAQTRSDMEKLLEQAASQHIGVLIATPHMTPGVKPFDRSLMRSRLEEAKRYCEEQGLDIQLLPGAELLFTPVFLQYLEEHRLPTLGNSSFILLEFMPGVAFNEIERAVLTAKRYGYEVIIAHAERYRCLWFGRKLADLKKKTGAFIQVNGNSVIKKQNWLLRYTVTKWLRAESIDFIASDAHNTGNRGFVIRNAYHVLRRICSPAYADKLCCDFLRRTT